MKNILFIASEAVPFIKTGGLADVVGSLPKCFDKQYFDVRVMIPKYLCIKESFRNEMKYVNHFYMDYLGQNRYVGILEYEYEGVTFYFIDNESYFWGDRPYGDWYYDLEKFSFFCKAALSSLPVIGFKPDVIHCHDWQTGLPYAIMGGTHITDLRTGAVSGVMAKYLAKQNSRVLSVVGAGAQGFTSMEMTMLAIGTIEQVRVCDLSEDRVRSFIEKAKGRFPKATFLQCKSNAEALQGADIVLYATSASAPILEGSNVPEGATVICVSEKLTPKTISMFDGWYVDFTECAIERYNADGRHAAQLRGMPYEDLTQQMVTGEIGEVITGAIPGRQNDKQRLLAASVGMSIEDVICADAVFKAAQRQNLGLVVDFENL